MIVVVGLADTALDSLILTAVALSSEHTNSRTAAYLNI